MKNHVYKINEKDISEATIMLTSIITKISYYLLIDYQKTINEESLYEIKEYLLNSLDISEELMSFYVKKMEYISVLGRYDWVLDKHNNLKCIEFNAETPAFQSDSISTNESFHDKWLSYYKDLYAKTSYFLRKEKLSIFCLCDMYYEDEIKDTLFLKNCLNFNVNVIDTLEFYEKAYWKDNVLYFKDTRVDVLWHPNTPLKEINHHTKTFIKDLEKNKNIVLWNSPISSLYSNKFLYVLMHEIAEKNLPILTNEEKDFIKKVIPYTSLDINKIKQKIKADVIIKKPCIGSCGEDVTLEKIKDIESNEQGFIYQEYIEPSSLSKHSDEYINMMSFISILDNIECIDFLGYCFKISDKKIFDDTAEFLSHEEYHNLYKLNNKH